MTELTHKQMVADGLQKRTYDITKKQSRGLEILREKKGTPASVSVRFALEKHLRDTLGKDYK